METQARVLATLNKLKEVQAQKQQKLGVIEDAINEQLNDLDNQAQEFIDKSQSLYIAIENFFNMRDNLISELSEANSIDINNVYTLLESYEEVQNYTDIDRELYMQLEDIESVLQASQEIISGLEQIRTFGIG
jgi:hypothetical protein